jgi:uncharacterized membrane protein
MKPLTWLKSEWLQLLILAAPFCAVALLWDKLPERLPIHWNYRGEIDGYAGKAYGTLFLPLINLGMALLLLVLPKLDPKCRKYDPETKASVAGVFRVCRLSVTLLLAVVAGAMLAVTLGLPLNFSRVVMAGFGGILVVMGNSMGRLRPNYFAGFRTPWTLESGTVWLKTHRLGGRLMVLSGAGVLLESWLLPVRFLILAGAVPVVLLAGIVPAAYSYFCYRAELRAAGKGR